MQETPGQNPKIDDLLRQLGELKSQLSKRDEELLRMSRMYSHEKDKVKSLERELQEKDLIISQLSMHHQTVSENNDTMFGKDDPSPKTPKQPSTLVKDA